MPEQNTNYTKSQLNKTVNVRKYAVGYGWDYGDKPNVKVADPVHKCILACYLGAGVTNPDLVIDIDMQEYLRVCTENQIKSFKKAINHFDNCEGDEQSLVLIKELANILKMQVRLVN